LIIKSYGEIGDGTSGNDKFSPVAVYTSGVLSGKNVLQITAGYYHTCVIADDSQPYCWGDNS
jgi:alpha-tubulin suppressor-like RCC1 family protein